MVDLLITGSGTTWQPFIKRNKLQMNQDQNVKNDKITRKHDFLFNGDVGKSFLTVAQNSEAIKNYKFLQYKNNFDMGKDTINSEDIYETERKCLQHNYRQRPNIPRI